MPDSWETLESSCRQCQACSLAEKRTNVVFGEGCQTAEIMFIGEAPGANEDKQGRPFVGKAGQLLDDMLEIIGLDRTMFYITNICKCRPPNNRDPMDTEQAACLPFLRRQTALLRPKIIVCLGRIAAMQLIKADFRITQEHGQWFEKAGIAMTAIYHPAALLRDPAKRPDTFLDLKSIQQEITRRCDRTTLRHYLD